MCYFLYIASPLTIWLDERAAAKERMGGGSTMKAKAAISDTDVRRTWILLGDPTMRLK